MHRNRYSCTPLVLGRAQYIATPAATRHLGGVPREEDLVMMHDLPTSRTAPAGGAL